MVGRRGRRPRQTLSLASRCYNDREIVHQFVHALGFHHEDVRPDRDKYVKINWDNINNKHKSNFRIDRNYDTFGVPYDALSIMHYFKSTAFSKNGSSTIEAKPVSKFLTVFYKCCVLPMHVLFTNV